jgi:hypothetical protein
MRNGSSKIDLLRSDPDVLRQIAVNLASRLRFYEASRTAA